MKMKVRLQQREPQKAETDQPNLTGIPTQMKLNFEQRSGMSFDDVRVHYNSDKPAQFHALAYTQGTQIYVGPGQERSLPHELGHVIQQKMGRVRPTRWVCGHPVNDQPELEREADRTPVQCMPVPAPQGVIQMYKVLDMPKQRGPNCGYHALARAMYSLFEPTEVGTPSDEDNLEKRLTSFAIGAGYSVVGEAFDPYILAEVGNEFCIKDEYFLQKGYKIECEVYNITTSSDLEKFITDNANSVILVPYFSKRASPGKREIDDYSPIDSNGEQGAHWGVVNVCTKGDNTSYKLYEGNFHGSTEGASTSPIFEPWEMKELSALVNSNGSIKSSFDWDIYLSGLVKNCARALKERGQINDIIYAMLMNADIKKNPKCMKIALGLLSDKKKAVLRSENTESFGSYEVLREKIQAVKSKIAEVSRQDLEGSPPAQSDSSKQDVLLAGRVVKVTRTASSTNSSIPANMRPTRT